MSLVYVVFASANRRFVLVSNPKKIALFGGAFNTPHKGHIEPLATLREQLGFDQILLLPSPAPPHKTIAGATYEERLTMLSLACQHYSALVIDEAEAMLPAPTYTIQTLRYFRQRYPDSSVSFIIGHDSLMQLDTWREWQTLLSLAHLIVLPRPNVDIQASETLINWIHEKQQHNVNCIDQSPNGALFFAETPLWDVSSTHIRHCLQTSGSNDELLDIFAPAVLDYIEQYGLYH